MIGNCGVVFFPPEEVSQLQIILLTCIGYLDVYVAFFFFFFAIYLSANQTLLNIDK